MVKDVEQSLEHETPLDERTADPKSSPESSEKTEANQWQDVGKANRTSPRRETQKNVSGNNIRTASPSRFQVLGDIEEDELESSSSGEDDEDDEASGPPHKEIKTISQDVDKPKTTSRSKAGANPQVQTDRKKSAKTTKIKNASNRRH